MATSWTPASGVNTSWGAISEIRVIPAGYAVGLLLALTYAEDTTVINGGFNTSYTPASTVATGWTPQ